jgi:hypothetical protein
MLIAIILAILLPVVYLILWHFAPRFKEGLWILREGWGKQVFLSWIISFLISGLTIYLVHLYGQLYQFYQGKIASYTFSRTILGSSFFSGQAGGVSLIVTTIYWFVFKPINRNSILEIVDFLDHNSADIKKIIVTTTSPAKIWLKQKELLLYLVSNIKINQNKVSRHVIGKSKLIKGYKEANSQNRTSLLWNPAALICRFHHNCINLYAHEDTCDCANDWKALPKDKQTFIYVEKTNNSDSVVYTYSSHPWGLFAEFEQIHDPSEKGKISIVATALEKCTTKIKL